ncbi:MAG: SAM-dependent methyltransferase, partial [Clostridia bacterium]
LKNGGMFITQQVAGDNDMMLSQRLIPGFRSAFPTHDLLHQKKAFEDHGLIVIYSDEALIPSCFYDVGAVVYYAKAIPWEFPGFSVEKCYSGLLDLHSDILKYGYISSNESRFIIETVNYKEDRI